MLKSTTILGYGAVGRETAALLSARGERVVIAQRKSPASLLPGAEFRACDLEQRDDVIAACRGASTVVLAAGLPYRSAIWERAWPAAMRNTLDGCKAAGARLVFADNLYMYGPQTTPLVETMPLTGYGRKPRVRAEITRLWQNADAKGEVRATAVRAADFYGPGVATSVISEFGVKAMLAGKPAMVLYPPDLPHDFTYVPDFARALVTLADAPDDAYGEAWHVPNAPTRSLRQVLERAAELGGVPLRIRELKGIFKAVLGVFMPDLRELTEMRFQTDRPYHVDARKFAGRFWADATSFDEGLTATIAALR